MKYLILLLISSFCYSVWSNVNRLRVLRGERVNDASVCRNELENANRQIAKLLEDVRLFRDGVESYKRKLELAEERERLCLQWPSAPSGGPASVDERTCAENPNLIACRHPRRRPPPRTTPLEPDEVIENPAPIRNICVENPNLIACRHPRRRPPPRTTPPEPDEVIENPEPIENPAPNQVRDYCDDHPYARDCPLVGSQGVR